MAWQEITDTNIKRLTLEGKYVPITARLNRKYRNNMRTFLERRFYLFNVYDESFHCESLTAVAGQRARWTWPGGGSADDARTMIYIPQYLVVGASSIRFHFEAQVRGEADYTFYLKIGSQSSSVHTATGTSWENADFEIDVTGLSGDETIEVEYYALKDTALASTTAELEPRNRNVYIERQTA